VGLQEVCYHFHLLLFRDHKLLHHLIHPVYHLLESLILLHHLHHRQRLLMKKLKHYHLLLESQQKDHKLQQCRLLQLQLDKFVLKPVKPLQGLLLVETLHNNLKLLLEILYNLLHHLLLNLQKMDQRHHRLHRLRLLLNNLLS
jgi:hypothetical protein